MAQPSPALPGSSGKMPLTAGLTIVTAINDKNGDYESIKRIETTSGDLVRIKYSSERPKPVDLDEVDNGKPRPSERLTTYRIVRRRSRIGRDVLAAVSVVHPRNREQYHGHRSIVRDPDRFAIEG
jgi:hypothetical protein